jgi:hypothetical protein
MPRAPVLLLLLTATAHQRSAPCGVLRMPATRGSPAAQRLARADSLFRAHASRHVGSPGGLLAERLLREYGAPIAAAESVVARPPAVVLWRPEDVAQFQRTLRLDSAVIGGTMVRLQAPALRALRDASARARRSGVRMAPRGGAAASLRSADQTERFWLARLKRGFERFVESRLMSQRQADSIFALPPGPQTELVLGLEDAGFCFGGAGEKTILHSVAAPGSSQHLFGYAIDIEQHGSITVRSLLARAGFWQTVLDDEPHFTYLGTASAAVLESRGLLRITRGSRTYWLPPPLPR